MSKARETAVWTYSGHGKGYRLALVSMADQAHDDGFCFPGHAYVAWRCNITVRSSERTIQALEISRELFVFRRTGRNNLYMVLPGLDTHDIYWNLHNKFDLTPHEISDWFEQGVGSIPWVEVDENYQIKTPDKLSVVHRGLILSRDPANGLVIVSWLPGLRPRQNDGSTPDKKSPGPPTFVAAPPTFLDEPPTPVSVESFNQVNPPKEEFKKTWQTIQNQLYSSLPRGTWQMRIQPAILWEAHPANGNGRIRLVIAVPDNDQREWMAARMTSQIQRMATGILAQETEVHFVLADGAPLPFSRSDLPISIQEKP